MFSANKIVATRLTGSPPAHRHKRPPACLVQISHAFVSACYCSRLMASWQPRRSFSVCGVHAEEAAKCRRADAIRSLRQFSSIFWVWHLEVLSCQWWFFFSRSIWNMLIRIVGIGHLACFYTPQRWILRGANWEIYSRGWRRLNTFQLRGVGSAVRANTKYTVFSGLCVATGYNSN